MIQLKAKETQKNHAFVLSSVNFKIIVDSITKSFNVMVRYYVPPRRLNAELTASEYKLILNNAWKSVSIASYHGEFDVSENGKSITVNCYDADEYSTLVNNIISNTQKYKKEV